MQPIHWHPNLANLRKDMLSTNCVNATLPPPCRIKQTFPKPHAHMHVICLYLPRPANQSSWPEWNLTDLTLTETYYLYQLHGLTNWTFKWCLKCTKLMVVSCPQLSPWSITSHDQECILSVGPVGNALTGNSGRNEVSARRVREHVWLVGLFSSRNTECSRT